MSIKKQTKYKCKWILLQDNKTVYDQFNFYFSTGLRLRQVNEVNGVDDKHQFWSASSGIYLDGLNLYLKNKK